MKNIKKLISTLIIIYLLSPVGVLACGGIDKYGNPYIHIHDSTNPNLPMLYPKKNHLYVKEVPMNNGDYTDIDEDFIITEFFSFPIMQDKQTYLGYYLYVDEALMNSYWDNMDDIDIKTTIEGVDTWLVTGTNYKLNVGLKNTFQESKKKYLNSKVELMYYNLEAKRLNINDKDQLYLNAKKKITNLKLNQIVPEILKIEAKINYIDTNWESANIEINKLYDKIEVKIYSNQKIENVVAVNLNKINSNNIIKAVYDNNDNAYKFEIEEAGTYILVKNDFDKELFDSAFKDEEIYPKNEVEKKLDETSENDEKNKPSNIMVAIVIVVVTLSIAIIIIIKKGTHNKK